MAAREKANRGDGEKVDGKQTEEGRKHSLSATRQKKKEDNFLTFGLPSCLGLSLASVPKMVGCGKQK